MTYQKAVKPLYIESVSVYGRGLPSWNESVAKLASPDDFTEEALGGIQCGFLSSSIKRRTTPHMQIAIYAAEQALQGQDANHENIELVFATSEGDLNIAHDICYALTLEDKPVSPQKFQNVILNAAAGHLGIIMKNTASATSVTGAFNSLAVGFLQAYTTAIAEEVPVLYVAYDAPSVLAINPDGDMMDPFSVGFLLKPYPSDKSLASLSLNIEEGEITRQIDNELLADISSRSSAAGSLPILVALAKKESANISLPYAENQVLNIEISPCL